MCSPFMEGEWSHSFRSGRTGLYLQESTRRRKGLGPPFIIFKQRYTMKMGFANEKCTDYPFINVDFMFSFTVYKCVLHSFVIFYLIIHYEFILFLSDLTEFSVGSNPYGTQKYLSLDFHSKGSLWISFDQIW